jgi:hypothetical protein
MSKQVGGAVAGGFLCTPGCALGTRRQHGAPKRLALVPELKGGSYTVTARGSCSRPPGGEGEPIRSLRRRGEGERCHACGSGRAGALSSSIAFDPAAATSRMPTEAFGQARRPYAAPRPCTKENGGHPEGPPLQTQLRNSAGLSGRIHGGEGLAVLSSSPRSSSAHAVASASASSWSRRWSVRSRTRAGSLDRRRTVCSRGRSSCPFKDT